MPRSNNRSRSSRKHAPHPPKVISKVGAEAFVVRLQRDRLVGLVGQFLDRFDDTCARYPDAANRQPLTHEIGMAVEALRMFAQPLIDVIDAEIPPDIDSL